MFIQVHIYIYTYTCIPYPYRIPKSAIAMGYVAWRPKISCWAFWNMNPNSDWVREPYGTRVGKVMGQNLAFQNCGILMSGLDDVIEHPWLSAVWATSGDENEENEDPPEDCKVTKVPQIFRPTPRLTHFIRSSRCRFERPGVLDDHSVLVAIMVA